jgi:hypothetical protein
MAKSKKVVSKKVVAPVEVAPVEAPAVPASEPVQAEAVAPTPASAPVPTPAKQARKGQAADAQAEDPRAKWARRLGRWAGKVEVAGLDPRALMAEYLDKA